MVRRPLLGLLCAWVATVATASPIAAQPPPTAADSAGEARDQEARANNQAGTIAYADGRFEDALGYFRRSYALSARPELPFTTGQCPARPRRDDEAIEAFERYLRERPDAPNARAVRSRIAAIRDAAARAAAAAPDSAEPASTEGRLWTWITAGIAVAL